MNLTCQYPKKQPSFLTPDDYCWTEPIDPLLLQYQVFPRATTSSRASSTTAPIPKRTADAGAGASAASPEGSSHSSTVPLSPSSVLSILPPAQPLVSLPSRYGRRPESPLRSQVAQTLTPVEFELLKHYLEHTSRDLTVDEDDQYTLQIGIPNLACESKPLMRSVLALAAICKCHDTINKPSVSRQDRAQILELLFFAHRYHMESMHEIQTNLREAKHYDHVLANAAMMGMYGSASHVVRIWLAKTATIDDPPVMSDFMPKYPQWISLYRAVDLAYFGLLNNTSGSEDAAQYSPAHSPVDPMTCGGFQLQYEYRVSARVEQTTIPTNHVMGPILAATVCSALAKLTEKARDVAMAEMSCDEVLADHDDPRRTPTAQMSSELQACFVALNLFSNAVTDAFAVGDSRPSTPGHGQLSFEVDIDPVGRLSEVQPWLRRYTASIISMIPSRLPRRTIAAFIHKVPTRYMNLVADMLNLIIQTEAPPGNGPSDTPPWSSPSPSTMPEPSIAHQLAIDIFAHWLVLVILLDNVWWIGGVGAWELGRVVSFRRRAPWPNSLWNKEHDWWPESMFEVSRQLEKHRRSESC
ncbi:putative C6 transcription factor [Lasiosphaeria ovina]|uniref:C6 transcription factor n=1 Tax=Lasiosphaeria ovina TaxID=92902 RepID=A0AAE0NF59_9PEZI|nr:putative C6 transcription factor [Lasiosphaeria ovina]